MIKWQSKFNIENSSIQVAEAFIKVKSFLNNTDSCEVEFNIVDTQELVLDDVPTDLVIKTYTRTFDRTFANEREIYRAEVLNYTDAELV